MPCITTCPKCGVCYEAVSEEAANEPTYMRFGRYCAKCFREGQQKAAEAADNRLRQTGGKF